LCSTPVLEMYEQLGFRVLPAELADRKAGLFKAKLPWEIVESIAATEGDWRASPLFRNDVHPASQRLWETYNIGDKVRLLFSDRMIGDDGDLTETRDNNSYVRAMDEIAGIKYERAAPFIRPGRIGDIGCAVGSWIRLASLDERFRESDLFGVEISRPLYEICEQRKTNGDFKNPYVFFSRKNAVDGLVFEPGSMNTIHTSSLTHEIWSYAGPKALRDFIRNRYIENLHGGVWVNQDVVGPENGDEIVYMRLNASDGVNEDVFAEFGDRRSLAAHLKGLSTRARFLRFSRDFRRDEGYNLDYSIETIEGEGYVRLKLRDACEFMSKKDYTDNWESEMHEVFCSLTYSDWCNAFTEAGYKILPGSGTYKNQWIEDNRYKGKVLLYRMGKGGLCAMQNPEGHMLIVGEK